MIVSKRVYIKISSNNKNYWKKLGYQFINPMPQKGIITTIEVNVEHLQKNSNVKIECWCEGCEKFFTNTFARYKQYCETCIKSKSWTGNNLGSKNKGKTVPNMTGDKHPRWNPDTKEYKKYAGRVYYLSEKVYKNNEQLINPNNHKRTLCGVENGYQLDHKISIKYGFYNNISPEELSDISNLQILSWKENRDKWHHIETL